MTLGKKIRKYRLLHNMKQKELGEKIGFKKSTADVRINQYEADKMAPKTDIREKLVETLDIDAEALSENNISTHIDIMYLLFELEECYHMDIKRENGKTYLVFDNTNIDIASLISYLHFWYEKKIKVERPNVTIKDKNDYLLWKSHIKKEIDNEYRLKEEEIINYYDKDIKKINNTSNYAVTTADITLLFREIIESGASICAYNDTTDVGINEQYFTFVVDELLLAKSKQKMLFAKFLLNYNHFKELGAKCYTRMQYTDKYTITYCIPVSSFSIITSQVNDLLSHYNDADKLSEFSNDSFERNFADDIKTHYNNIEDEIKRYS